MEQLAKIVAELQVLAEQNQWEQIVERDEEIRKAITDFMINHSMTGDKQGSDYLHKLREIYSQGVASLETNQDESAREMKKIQKGLSAAKSYLDLTRF